MSNLSNFHKTLSVSTLGIIIVFFVIVFIISATGAYANVSIDGSPQFASGSVFDLYEKNIKKNIFFVRYDVNKMITDIGIDDAIVFYNQFVGNEDVTRAIIQAAIANNTPVNLSMAQAWRESRFNPKEVSRKNSNGSRDRGLFQLNDKWHKYPLSLVFDPYFNAFKGTEHLAEMLERNDGNTTLALYCYNAGYDKINVQNIIPNSTIQYTHDVLEYEDMLNIEFNKWIS